MFVGIALNTLVAIPFANGSSKLIRPLVGIGSVGRSTIPAGMIRSRHADRLPNGATFFGAKAADGKVAGHNPIAAVANLATLIASALALFMLARVTTRRGWVTCKLGAKRLATYLANAIPSVVFLGNAAGQRTEAAHVLILGGRQAKGLPAPSAVEVKTRDLPESPAFTRAVRDLCRMLRVVARDGLPAGGAVPGSLYRAVADAASFIVTRSATVFALARGFVGELNSAQLANVFHGQALHLELRHIHHTALGLQWQIS